MKRWATLLSALLAYLRRRSTCFAVFAERCGARPERHPCRMGDAVRRQQSRQLERDRHRELETGQDGVVIADNGNGFLVSKTAYADFQLRAEFWLEDKTNSGIFIRCTDPNSVIG